MLPWINKPQVIEAQVCNGSSHRPGYPWRLVELNLNPKMTALMDEKEVKFRPAVRSPEVGLIWFYNLQYLF